MSVRMQRRFSPTGQLVPFCVMFRHFRLSGWQNLPLAPFHDEVESFCAEEQNKSTQKENQANAKLADDALKSIALTAVDRSELN